MIVDIKYSHDTGVWKSEFKYTDTDYPNKELSSNLLAYQLGDTINDGGNKRSEQVSNQVISINRDKAYSTVNVPTNNSVARSRVEVTCTDSTYRLLSNYTIRRLIYKPNFEGKESVEEIVNNNKKAVGGNADMYIDKEVLKQIMYYIYSRKSVFDKGYLIIKVPKFQNINGKNIEVHYGAYCRAIIEKILYSLPIEMRLDLSFATLPNKEGVKNVGISFEPIDRPMEDIAAPKVFLHNPNCVQDPRIKNAYVDPQTKKIISACVDNPNLSQEFYGYCVQYRLVDPTKGITQLRGESFKQEFMRFYNEYMRNNIARKTQE